MFVEFLGIEDDDSRVVNHLTIGNIYEVKHFYTLPGRNLTVYTIINDTNISCVYNAVFFRDATHKIRDEKINNILNGQNHMEKS